MIGELRPVVFRYREEVVGDSEAKVLRYGLIAEEVAEVAPHLATYDGEGRPKSVQYRLLAPLLLNEAQKQQRTIEEQRARLGLEVERNEAQETQIATLLTRLDALESQLAGESAGTD